jgi:type IV pilus assembly protein PilM
MSFLSFLKDPPPAHVFELSEAGIAHARGAQPVFEKFPHTTLKASPSEDNFIRLDTAAETIAHLAPPAPNKKRRQAAVLLPDAAARVTVLDFDSFPDSAEEQLSLVKFRVKKTIPFDIDSAAVNYFRQPGANRKGKIEVVAVTVALGVLARYEALFRNAGFHPGDITVSALAALNLYHDEAPALVAKLAGTGPAGPGAVVPANCPGADNTLTVMVVAGGKLKLFRCLTLEESTEEEILGVLHPTLAYAEDELGAPVKRVILCGFSTPPLGLPCETEPLRSRAGMPTAFNAGLYGYMEASTR